MAAFAEHSIETGENGCFACGTGGVIFSDKGDDGQRFDFLGWFTNVDGEVASVDSITGSDAMGFLKR